jgi:hypothetical protein
MAVQDTSVTFEEREGSYRYVRITVDRHGDRRELATNSAGEGLFYRTIYPSGTTTDWKQSKGTLQFSARSLRDFRSKVGGAA